MSGKIILILSIFFLLTASLITNTFPSSVQAKFATSSDDQQYGIVDSWKPDSEFIHGLPSGAKLLSSEEIALKYPHLPSAKQIWSGTIGFMCVDLRTSVLDMRDIVNCTEPCVDLLTGKHGLSEGDKIWLQYNEGVWISVPNYYLDNQLKEPSTFVVDSVAGKAIIL
jgi:hypothetical protein